MGAPTTTPPSTRTLPPAHAWRNAIGVSVLLWVVLGVGCFGIGAQTVADHYGSSVGGAFVLDLIFLAGVLIVIAAVLGWQRAHGETLRELGWRRPTTGTALAVGIVFGLAWTASGYARGGDPLAFTWQRPVMAVIGVALAFGEEVAVRGFFLEQLRRGGVRTWVQVVASGLMMGVYHGVIGLSFSPLYAVSSAVLFAVVSLIFVLGRRSLTPGLVAHSTTHVLGDPTLMQGILRGVLA